MGIFLRLDGVKGKSRTPNFEGWIELASASIGAARGVVGASSGTGSPTGTETQVHCTGTVGDHSVALQNLAVDGRTVDGELVFTSGGTRYVEVSLKGVLVASFAISGHGGGTSPMESFDLQTLPFKVVRSAEAALIGRWHATIGQWNGLFVFESGGQVHWTELNGTSRHNGLWKRTAADVQWRFASPGDVRTFVIPVPLPEGKISGRILPAGQGYFSMARA